MSTQGANTSIERGATAGNQLESIATEVSAEGLPGDAGTSLH